MPDQPMVESSEEAVPFKPNVLTMDVIHLAAFLLSSTVISDLSVELYAEISSEMAAIARGVLKESQRASKVCLSAFAVYSLIGPTVADNDSLSLCSVLI